MLFSFSCNDKAYENEEYPTNLKVEVVYSEDINGYIQIYATAENTVKFEFRLNNSENPEEENSTGIFEYTYYQEGDYIIDVRAVGESGRYLKEIVYINIVFIDNEVDVSQGYISPLEYEGYILSWNDEFNGSTINTDSWVFEIGTGCPNLCGWGNNELQYYRQQNAWVGNGVLTIEARKESYYGSQYTSARIKTQGYKSFQYGRIDIRALLPKGQGIWPALWMLGNNITSAGWPS